MPTTMPSACPAEAIRAVDIRLLCQQQSHGGPAALRQGPHWLCTPSTAIVFAAAGILLPSLPAVTEHARSRVAGLQAGGVYALRPPRPT